MSLPNGLARLTLFPRLRFPTKLIQRGQCRTVRIPMVHRSTGYHPSKATKAAYDRTMRLYLRTDFRSRRFNSSDAAPDAKPAKPPTFFKKYGASAVIVYLVLSGLDFMACYVAVHNLPQSTVVPIERKARSIIDSAWTMIGYEGHKEQATPVPSPESPEKATFWTEVALAYGIHKILNVIRLPFAAAITPPIVKALARRGYRVPGAKHLDIKPKSQS